VKPERLRIVASALSLPPDPGAPFCERLAVQSRRSTHQLLDANTVVATSLGIELNQLPQPLLALQR